MVNVRLYVGMTVMFAAMSSFLFIGSLINIIQLILYLTLKQWNGRLFKKINSFLIRIIYSPPLAICYYWANFKLNINYADKSLLQEVMNPMLALLVINHTYELDWVASLLLGDQFNDIGNYKSVSKKELMHLPVVGWTMRLSDQILVSRSWSKDKENLEKCLGEMLDYNRTSVGIFCEGTRWTKEKYEASVKYAKSIGIKPFKHHLLPRAKGFNFCARYFVKAKSDGRLKQPFYIYNIQILMPKKTSFRDLIEGNSATADIFVEKAEFNDKLMRTIENCQDNNQQVIEELTEFLYKIYTRKDELVDCYLANNGQFDKNLHTYPFKRNITSLIVTLIGLCLVYSMLIYICLFVISRSVALVALALVVVSVSGLIRKIDRESQSKYASKYGIASKKKE